MSNANGNWFQAPVWEPWRELTRLLWSGRIAFATEIKRVEEDPKLDIQLSDAGANYSLPAAEHIEALTDRSLFHSLILQKSYSLMESHAKQVMYICEAQDWSMLARMGDEDFRAEVEDLDLKGGLAAWSQKAMDASGQDWSQVMDGKSGLVEVSMIRNALVHGRTVASESWLKAVANSGTSVPFAPSQQIKLTFELLHTYRGRMRSFCRIIGDGVVHLARGTHRKT